MKSSKSFIKSYFKKLPFRLVILLSLFIGALFLFVYVAHEVLWEKEEAADNLISNYISVNVVNGRFTGLMKTVTYFGSATFLQIAYSCLFLFYLIAKNLKRAVEVAIVGFGGYLVNYFMKLSFHRIRPPHPLVEPLQTFSFPSGHATSAFIFYGLLAYLFWKTNLSRLLKFIFAAVLILFSLLIGFSRVYLRLHYPSDVAAGFCIGFAWLILTIYLFERLKKQADVEETRQE